MELQLVEGRFWDENDPDSIRMLILNEAAVKMLGGESPLEKTYLYWGQAQVIGVVKDFYYDNPIEGIAPIALNRIFDGRNFNVRFHNTVSRVDAEAIVSNVIRHFEPDFVLNPMWNIDIYNSKFKGIETVTRIVLIASIISILITVLGLLAIHLYSVMRRTKEIAIRRINGATSSGLFSLLSFDILKWIAIAALIAVPLAYYILSNILSNYANHVSLDWTVFALPIVIQCIIALLATSGVTFWSLSHNPVESLKTE